MFTAETFLSGESLAIVETIAPRDILVGVPVRSHAQSIQRLLEALVSGFQNAGMSRQGAILVLNAGSRDATHAAVNAWRAGRPAEPAVHWLDLSMPYRGRALLALCAAAHGIGARACAFVDADLTGVTPAWVPALLTPILEQAACVLPLYSRPVSEGTLSTNLLVPVTRALYGKRVHEVIGGCAGISPSLAASLLDPALWQGDHRASAFDLLLTTQAVASGATIAEAPLGLKRVAGGWEQPDLATTLVYIVGGLFATMEHFHERWDAIQGSVPIADQETGVLPPVAGARIERMVDAFRMGLKDLLPVWEQIMPEETLADLYPLGVGPAEEFRFPAPVWARAVFDFALAFHDRQLPRDHILRALAPLYLGRVAGFLHEVRRANGGYADILEEIGRRFEHAKEEFRFRWR